MSPFSYFHDLAFKNEYQILSSSNKIPDFDDHRPRSQNRRMHPMYDRKEKRLNYASYYNYDCHEVGFPTFKTISYLMTLVSYDSCKRDPKQNNPVKYVLEIKSEVSAKMIGEVRDIVFDNKVKHLC